MIIDTMTKAIITSEYKVGYEKPTVGKDTVILVLPDNLSGALNRIKEEVYIPKNLDTESISPRNFEQPMDRELVCSFKKAFAFRSLHCEGNIGVRLGFEFIKRTQQNYHNKIDYLLANVVKISNDFENLGHTSSGINNLARNTLLATYAMTPATNDEMLAISSSFKMSVANKNKRHPFHKQEKERLKFDLCVDKLILKALDNSWPLLSIFTFQHSFFDELVKLFWKFEFIFDHSKLSNKLNMLVKANNNIKRLSLARSSDSIIKTKKYLSYISTEDPIYRDYEQFLLSNLNHFSQINAFDIALLDNHDVNDVNKLVELFFTKIGSDIGNYQTTYAFYRFFFPYLKNWELALIFNKRVKPDTFKSDISKGYVVLSEIVDEYAPELADLYIKIKNTNRLYLVGGDNNE